MSKPKYAANTPLDALIDRAWLAVHDEVAVPEVVAEWAEGSFRTGMLTALAMVGVDRRDRRGAVTRAAIAEAVARLDSVPR